MLKEEFEQLAMRGHGALSIPCDMQMHLNNHAGATR